MTTKNLVLIVEDQPKLATLLHEYLEQAGYQTHIIDNGLDVIPWIRENSPSLVLLDIMLPGKDGMVLCKEIRTFSQIPVLMVTARIEEIDRLLGLELGADDYICKPFSPREVVARVKAVLRRSHIENDNALQNEIFYLDEERYSVSYHGQPLNLTVVEFRLLKKLLTSQGKVYSRSQLIDQLYDDHRIVNDRTVDTHVKNLRKKLEYVAPNDNIIRSVYGVGYKLDM